ncbi:MAG: ABC transporter substrate-binding protein [Prevotella sp.]|nr:ABC transporter substrate-binding protein [Prevotella sp.]
MKKILAIMAGVALLAACGQSYEETKRIARENRREAMRRDSAALKIAVMPTLDCLPLYVAEHYGLLDSLNGGVRLKRYTAQMDCDTALTRGRVEGSVSDLVRAKRMERDGMKLRYVATTNAYWLLVANRNARIRQTKQLDDKMVAMTRLSATDMLSDMVVDSARIDNERVFRVQINDLSVRMQMLQNNEMDALWLTEPQATAARLMKHNTLMDSRRAGVRLGTMVFREKEMRREGRSRQLQLLVTAYNQACDSINKYGVRHYGRIISERCGVAPQVADSLPATLRYEHAHGPLQQDVTRVEQWLDKRLGAQKKKDDKK